MALFDERYGKEVRAASIDDSWSEELCAGTHVPSIGKTGLVSILGESSIGPGMRHIDALVDEGVYVYGAKEHALASQLTGIASARPEELPERIDAVLSCLKSIGRKVAALRREKPPARTGDVLDGRRRIGKSGPYWTGLDNVISGDDVRTVTTDARGRIDDSRAAVVVVGGVVNSHLFAITATISAARQADTKAGKLVSSSSKILGEGGGGRDDVAQGGGQDLSKFLETLEDLEAQLS